MITRNAEEMQGYWNTRYAEHGARAHGHIGRTAAEINILREKRRAFVLPLVPRDLVTLEFGCGPGDWSEFFIGYLGVDFCQKAIELAQEKSPEKFFTHIGHDLSSASFDFDLFFTANCLQHCSDNTVKKVLAWAVEMGAQYFFFYEAKETQSGHMRGRTADEYARIVEKSATLNAARSWDHKLNAIHTATLITIGSD